MSATTYRVTAKRWAQGWELHISGIGVTQAPTLERADRSVRDYLTTMLDADEILDEVVITPELDGLEIEAAAARAAVADAARLQKEAAVKSREAARALRAAGLSVGDTAAVLGISRGRVSQLAATQPGRTDSITERLDSADH